MNVVTTRLSNLCKVITKGTTPTSIGYSFSDRGIVFLRVQNINGGKVNYDQQTLFIDELTHKTLSRSQIFAGDILVSIAGTIGRAGIVPDNAPPLNCNQAVAIVRANEDIFRPYLRHWLESNDAQSQMIGATVTGTISNLSLTQIGNLQVPLPPLEEQRRIAEILDRAQSLISKRREAIGQLDTLPQAIFIEMFGDPVTNPKGWKIKICKSICSRITVGIVVQPASYYQEYGVPALRSQNIKQNSISTDNLVFFSQIDNETKLAKTRVRSGDVVLVRTGQPGTAAIIPEELDGVNAIDLLITTPCKNIVDSVYLCSFFNSAWGKKLVSSSQVGQIQKHLNVGILNNAQIICPPLPLQQEFAHRVEAVEKLKAAHRASLSELNALFASLQHRAFRGEL